MVEENSAKVWKSSSSASSCFFCYKCTGVVEEWTSDDTRRGECCRRFLILLQRYLKSKIGQEDDFFGGDEEWTSSKKMILFPCEDCFKLLDSFCKLYDELRVLELRIDWNVRKLESVMRDAERIPSRVQFFRECVSRCPPGISTDDVDTKEEIGVKFLEGVVRTRRTFIAKCKEKLMKAFPKVVLQRHAAAAPPPAPPPGVGPILEIEEPDDDELVEGHDGSSTTPISKLETDVNDDEVVSSPVFITEHWKEEEEGESFGHVSSSLSFTSAPTPFDSHSDLGIDGNQEYTEVSQQLTDNEARSAGLANSQLSSSSTSSGVGVLATHSGVKTTNTATTTSAVFPETTLMSFEGIGRIDSGAPSVLPIKSAIPTGSLFRVIVNPDKAEGDNSGSEEGDHHAMSISSDEEIVSRNEMEKYASDEQGDDDNSGIPLDFVISSRFQHQKIKRKPGGMRIRSRAIKLKMTPHHHQRHFYYHCDICPKKEKGGRRGRRRRRYKYLSHIRQHLKLDHQVKPAEIQCKRSSLYTKRIMSNVEVQKIQEKKSAYTAPSDISPSKSISDYKIFSCPKSACRARFFHPKALQPHLKCHGRFKCNFCSAVMTTAVSIALHELEHHHCNNVPPSSSSSSLPKSQEKVYSCRRCEWSGGGGNSKPDYLRHHLATHLQLSTITGMCPICPKTFSYISSQEVHDGRSYQATLGHMKTCHDVSGMSPKNIQKCSLCPAYFKTCKQLDAHRVGSHSAVYKQQQHRLECETCKKSFRDRRSLRGHRNRMHVKTQDGKFQCTTAVADCGKYFATLLDLENHMRYMHSKSRTVVPCPKQCGKRIPEWNLPCHIRRVHEGVKRKPQDKRICATCGKQVRDLKRHNLQSHLGPDDWPESCPFCDRKCLSRAALEAHIRGHIKEKPFLCWICGMEYSNPTSFQHHLQKEHRVPSNEAIVSEPPPINESDSSSAAFKTSEQQQLPVFPCSVFGCAKRFLSADSLEQHSKHHGLFKCFGCEDRRAHSTELALHEIMEHSKKIPPGADDDGGKKKKVYNCPRCDGFTSKVKAEYLRHHSEVHLQLPRVTWTCPICSISCEAKITDNLTHFKNAHDVSAMDPANVAKCNQCPAYFTSYPTLDRHMRNAHLMPIFHCGDCDKTFKRRFNLRLHRHRRHVKADQCRSFVCSKEGCGARYETFGDLQSHKRYMHNSKGSNMKAPCPTCGKMIWKHGLGRHMTSCFHGKKGPAQPKPPPKHSFICDQCGVSFKDNYKLRQHQLSHSGPSSWEYTCPICGKKCSLLTSLEAHIRTHTGEKPFICQGCGEAYAHRHNLRAHVNRTHSDVMEDKAREVVRRKITSRKGVKVKHVYDKNVVV